MSPVVKIKFLMLFMSVVFLICFKTNPVQIHRSTPLLSMFDLCTSLYNLLLNFYFLISVWFKHI